MSCVKDDGFVAICYLNGCAAQEGLPQNSLLGWWASPCPRLAGPALGPNSPLCVRGEPRSILPFVLGALHQGHICVMPRKRVSMDFCFFLFPGPFIVSIPYLQPALQMTLIYFVLLICCKRHKNNTYIRSRGHSHGQTPFIQLFSSSLLDLILLTICNYVSP